MLRTKVKASSVTNLTDARYFAAWGAEWLGFDLRQGSDTSVQPQLVHAIKGWVDGVEILGEFDLETASEILTTAELLELNKVQLGMFSELETAIEVQSKVPIIKEIVLEKNSTFHALEDLLENFAPYTLAFLIDFEKNNITWDQVKSGQPFNSIQLKTICEQYQVLLSMPFSSPNILEEVLSDIQPFGINLKGGEEEKVGYKSFDELDELFEALEDGS